jgi:hypothetical protein
MKRGTAKSNAGSDGLVDESRKVQLEQMKLTDVTLTLVEHGTGRVTKGRVGETGVNAAIGKPLGRTKFGTGLKWHEAHVTAMVLSETDTRSMAFKSAGAILLPQARKKGRPVKDRRDLGLALFACGVLQELGATEDARARVETLVIAEVSKENRWNIGSDAAIKKALTNGRKILSKSFFEGVTTHIANDNGIRHGIPKVFCAVAERGIHDLNPYLEYRTPMPLDAWYWIDGMYEAKPWPIEFSPLFVYRRDHDGSEEAVPLNPKYDELLKLPVLTPNAEGRK